MESIGGLSASLEANLGVGSGTAQVFTWLVILSVCYLLLQILQASFGGILKKSRARGNLTLLFGQCGAGKTALFFRLRDQEEVQSVSSLNPIRDSFKVKVGEEQSIGPIEIVDYPGHLRYRNKANELVKEARCIVYVVDSDDKQRLKDVAEHLYELMTLKDIFELQTPLLLALNKCDLTSARSEKYVIEEIEREIEQMRVSRAATLEGQDSADSFLGVDGQKFKLLEHSPCPIQVCRISVKQPDLDPVLDFIQQHYT
ncbi:unnamed protein product [Polarella glacialis]|uniref:Signal recognition particle receptor subunit beta n=1 Tax=Polarella glacialis TaxID=89957 RepID=A0A813I0Z8_POLGL|nr:unnamed protein product [Polarella glacialis]|mmetsp:Transcript_10424/g.16661  ORF Transcript_10424/g.16661 Transcript_10424/m.16661 type:complete len:257 (-) Transcript_10424:61-831(-)